jgi:hypothetical protein
MVLLLPADTNCDVSCMAGTNAKSATSIDKKEFDSTPMPFYKLMQRLFPVILCLAASQVGSPTSVTSDVAVHDFLKLNFFCCLMGGLAEVGAAHTGTSCQAAIWRSGRVVGALANSLCSQVCLVEAQCLLTALGLLHTCRRTVALTHSITSVQGGCGANGIP